MREPAEVGATKSRGTDPSEQIDRSESVTKLSFARLHIVYDIAVYLEA